MTAPPLTTEYISGRDEEGIALETPIPCIVQGPIRRTIGTAGDDLVVHVSVENWPIEDLDKSKRFDLTFGDADAPIVLGGYHLREERTALFGGPMPETEDENVPLLVELRFVTVLGMLKEGRGGLLREKTFNPLKADGLVDTLHADYRTTSQLVEIALDAIGLDYEELPATLDELDPPAPVDWGNCRAMPELEALLARCGHTLCLSNDGTTLRVIRLPQPGEEVELPSAWLDPDVAEPFELRKGPPVKAKNIIVTSGRTRTIIVTDVDLDQTEWVWYDSATKRWLNNAQTATLYSGTPQPGDITKLRLPPKTPAERKTYNRLFTALRVTGDDFQKVRRLVSISAAAELEDGSMLNGASVIAYGKCCIELVSGQLRRVPEAIDDDPVRIDGVRAVANEGVFIFPGEVIPATLTDTAGGYGDLQALSGDDLYLIFAHEANRGDDTDYFRVGYKAELSSGRVVATEMTEEEFDAAIDDPTTVIIEAEYLRQLMIWANGEEEPYTTNTDELKAIAQKLARIRAAADYVESGDVDVHGLQDIAPGDYEGAASSVVWSTNDRITTVLINEHEVPDGFLSELELDAERSFLTGIRRFINGGTSVSVSDIRSGGAPSPVAGNGATAAMGEPAAMSSTRGSEKTLPHVELASPPAPTMARRGDASRFMARITGSTVLADNKWTYSWEEVFMDDSGDWQVVDGGRNSSTHGQARNRWEAGNTATGVQGNGIDIANLPEGFEIKPISPDTVHEMLGPFGPAGSFKCHFGGPNGTDGACPEGEGGGA